MRGGGAWGQETEEHGILLKTRFITNSQQCKKVFHIYKYETLNTTSPNTLLLFHTMVSKYCKTCHVPQLFHQLFPPKRASTSVTGTRLFLSAHCLPDTYQTPRVPPRPPPPQPPLPISIIPLTYPPPPAISLNTSQTLTIRPHPTPALSRKGCVAQRSKDKSKQQMSSLPPPPPNSTPIHPPEPRVPPSRKRTVPRALHPSPRGAEARSPSPPHRRLLT